MLFAKYVTVCIITFSCLIISAQKSNNNTAAFVDSLVKETFKNYPVASISVAIKKNDRVLMEKSYGLANVQLNVPATIHSIYTLNSISKMFTAISVLQLEEQGKLSLDDEIGKWLTGFDSVKRKITISQLLSHSSGFKNYGGESWRKNYKSFTMTPAEWVDLSKNADLDFPPGTSYNYSNAGFDVLAFIVEKVSGEPFPDYVKQHIILPAHLNETGHYSIQAIVPQQVSLYDVIKNKLYRADEWGEPAYGSGAIYSSIEDILKFEDAINKKILLKSSSLQKMRTSLIINDQNFFYGLGTRIVNVSGHFGFGHTGSGGGATSVLTYFPDDDLAIVVLMNSENYDDSKYPSAPSVAQAIEERIFNIPKVVVKDLPIPVDEIQKYTGNWLTPDVTILERNGRLWASRNANDSTRLFYQGDHKFIPENNHSVVLEFVFENGSTDQYNAYLSGTAVAVGRRKK
jgi:CubicO group peptidase (beta-lactamase class C family)